MTARAFDIDDRRQEASVGTLTRYQLDVIALSVEDVVGSAGGWLFDRAMAGWEVNLRLAEPANARPFQILGINTVEPVTDWPRTQAIAVAADVYNTDERVREYVVMALERGLAEVTLWGDTWPPEFHQRAEAVQHHLSAAALAFKTQALAATQLAPASATGTEKFRSGSHWNPPYEPDLMPIG